MEGEQKKPQSIRALRLPGGQKLIAYECTPSRALQTCTGRAGGANQKCCSIKGTKEMLRRGHRIASPSACRRPVVPDHFSFNFNSNRSRDDLHW